MKIGEKIKKAIEESYLTQEKVAAHADMSMANLYKIYKRDSVESRYLIKIAEVLNIPVDYFLFDDTHDETDTYTVNNSGFGNAGRDIQKQKIMPGATYNDANSGSANIENIAYKLQMCEAEKKSLMSQLELKDQLLATKDQLIEQLKK